MSTAIIIFGTLCFSYFIYEGIVAPSLRLHQRFRLFALRDELREVRRANLKDGRSKDCGCSRKETVRAMGKARRKPGNTSTINSKIVAYKRGAVSRNLIWGLTKEEFLSVTSQPCLYCGEPPANINKSRGKFSDGDFRYTGIDRINSEEGYTQSNVVPACIQCNIAKSNKNLKEFIPWIRKIYARIPHFVDLVLSPY